MPVEWRTRGTRTRDEIFLGLAFTCGLDKVVLPFLDRGHPGRVRTGALDRHGQPAEAQEDRRADDRRQAVRDVRHADHVAVGTRNDNVAINDSEPERSARTWASWSPIARTRTYCSAGQLSPLLNDPYYETIGVVLRIWLAGAQGHVYAEGTQHAGDSRTPKGVPKKGPGRWP